MLVLFGGDGVVLIDVLCALGGGGGMFGVLWRFDVCIGRFRGVRLVLGVFGR